MKNVVVDSNVAVVANGRDTHANEDCQLTCISELEHVVRQRRVAIDTGDFIFAEYRNHLHFSGRPGTGDMFFKFLFDNRYNPKRVFRVTINPSGEDRGFAELPPNRLDPSDRKFLAVAAVAQAPILNATDSDWKENSDLLDRLDVDVVQLCPEFAG